MKKIKIATVFSGIGSVEFALKRMNIDHEIIFACDNGEIDIEIPKHQELFEFIRTLPSIEEKKKYIDEVYSKLTRRTNFVKKSYLANYKCDENRYFNDIRFLDGRDFKDKVDLLVGGSPCQSFSYVGQKLGLDDARGTLFYEFARLIKEIKPKVFIYENVRNLLNHDNGKTWKVILSIFDELGYSISFEILNSSDYGIPQSRRRLFVVGYLDKTKQFSFPKAAPLKFCARDFLIENCDINNFIHDEEGKIIIGKNRGQYPHDYVLSPKIYSYVMKGGTKNRYQRPTINLPIARTLLKTMGNHHRAGVDNYYSYDGTNDFGKVRSLTEREALRFMGFTDDFKIVVSKAQTYKQAGNSIVVDVMMSILKSIINDGVWEEQ